MRIESDEAVLIRAILARPDDAAPRLAMADWCEENGQGARARWLRDIRNDDPNWREAISMAIAFGLGRPRD